MMTPSHLIIGAAAARAARRRVPVSPAGVWAGSVAPDVALFVLSVGTGLYFAVTEGRPVTGLHAFMFDELFFRNPWWIALHNLLHAPLLLGVGIALTWRFRARRGTPGFWWFWFLVAASAHTALDVLTHVDDGPLVLFPLNWEYRFRSAVSYWDPAHFGRVFFWFELALDALLIAYLLLSRHRARQAR